MAAQPAPVSAAPADAPLTVSQLAGRITTAIADGLPAKVRVIGEVSNFRERTHWYFDLKVASAVVSCAMFAGAARPPRGSCAGRAAAGVFSCAMSAAAARRARFTPRSGQEVVATGRVEFWDKAGKVSLIVDKLEPVGAGALELAFRALCDELTALGWFETARKRPVPGFPRRVAVITSRAGAAPPAAPHPTSPPPPP